MAINNFGIQEFMPHQDVVNEVFKINYSFNDGYMKIDDSPGTGIDIDEKRAGDFPYSKASLPVNRKTDGTLFYW